MPDRVPMLRTLLIVFAASLVLATLVGLGLGFDLFVTPPAVADDLDLPSRLLATEPYFDARWPFDAASSLLTVVAFGALALAAGPISSFARSDGDAAVLRSAILIAGVLGLVAGLVYVGATKAAVDLAYCDCGFKTEETISQFWALNLIQAASTWVGYGAIIFGALAAALSAVLLPKAGMPDWWRGVAVAAAVVLVLGLVLSEGVDSPIGDLLTAVATGILLPLWALALARRGGTAAT